MQEAAIQTFVSSRTARKSSKNYLGWIDAEASSGQPRQQEARRRNTRQIETNRGKTRHRDTKRLGETRRGKANRGK
jgi:hypothetical protein